MSDEPRTTTFELCEYLRTAIALMSVEQRTNLLENLTVLLVHVLNESDLKKMSDVTLLGVDNFMRLAAVGRVVYKQKPVDATLH